MARKSNDSRPRPNEIITNRSESSEEANPPNAEKAPTSPVKRKKNFVERRSSVTGTNNSGCSWKDIMCVLFVVATIALAGMLRLQEELFGTVEKMRLESDSDADYYEILGIAHSATVRDVKKAFRDKVKELHPDHHPECLDCQQRFISCTKAYDVLVDSEQRKIYDETRGSYEPIMSDYSVSLTSFNYQRLVAESSSVWVIQVYDDLDSYSVHFASQWDSVAGSSDFADHVKFGRVNVRRDRALLSRLPMRAKLFPTVLMFSRDTMPSIFSIADTSSAALRKWIKAEMPHHVGESSSYNRYEVVLTGTRPEEKATGTVELRAASVRYSRVFDLSYEKGNGWRLSVKDKETGAIVIKGLSTTEKTIGFTLESVLRRLPIPLNHHNLYDVCRSATIGNYEATNVQSILCVSVEGSAETLPQPLLDGEFAIQQVVLADSKNPHLVIDLQASMVATANVAAVDHITVDDLKFEPVIEKDFIAAHLPWSVLDFVSSHKMLIGALVLGMGLIGVLTRLSAVQVTVAVLGLSMLIGVANGLASINWRQLMGKLIR